MREPVDTKLRPNGGTLSPESFSRFAHFITGALGIKMCEAKLPMLQSRLLRRLRELGMSSLEEYRDYLFNSPAGREEQVHFIDAVTTNKTDFFREPHHFEFLTRTLLPELGSRTLPGSAWTFNAWCAGCSTGEEPYTLSIVLSEFAASHRGFDFRIFATDISTRVLEQAMEGIYDEKKIEPISQALKRKYLLRSKDPTRRLVRIRPELRSRVRFRRLNFMDADYAVHEMFEVIFFRNVMIYFDRSTQEAVIRKLCRNLKPGGHLFVGHAESLAGLDLPVMPVGTAIYRKAP